MKNSITKIFSQDEKEDSKKNGSDEFAEKFLKTRQFENLKEIVDSDIYKVIKDRKKEESIQKYIHIDLDALYSLQSELSAYLLLLGINNEEDYDNDYLMGEE